MRLETTEEINNCWLFAAFIETYKLDKTACQKKNSMWNYANWWQWQCLTRLSQGWLYTNAFWLAKPFSFNFAIQWGQLELNSTDEYETIYSKILYIIIYIYI